MYTIERIRKEFKEICATQNVRVDVDISLNSRLSRTLGRVHQKYVEDHYEPAWVEFSKSFIESATDEEILAIIRHEAAHFITTAITGERHGHDKVFKSYCAKIGCDNDKTTFKRDDDESMRQMYKYSIYCRYCGKIVGSRSRKCSIVNNPEDWSCGICQNFSLEIIQNW